MFVGPLFSFLVLIVSTSFSSAVYFLVLDLSESTHLTYFSSTCLLEILIKAVEENMRRSLIKKKNSLNKRYEVMFKIQ